MECRIMEINLQYAKDLNKVNLLSKMDVYVVVFISGGDKNSKQKTKSPVDHHGDSNPTWNFQMKFMVDETSLQQNRLTLDFKIICERALGNKDVGEVQVPLKELFYSPEKVGADGKRFVCYQVRKPSGKPKGQLTFSYQFGDKNAIPAQVAPPHGNSEWEPVMAYSAGTPIHYSHAAAGPSSGYPPPLLGVYPPPYAAMEGGGHYPPLGAYPPPGGAPPPPPPPPPYGYGYTPQPYGYGYLPPRPPQWYEHPPRCQKTIVSLGWG